MIGNIVAGLSAKSKEKPTTVDYLVVAGGGSGGGSGSGGNSGGGGAGGFRTATGYTLPASFTVTVGGGGAATTGQGNDGTNSVFDTIT